MVSRGGGAEDERRRRSLKRRPPPLATTSAPHRTPPHLLLAVGGAILPPLLPSSSRMRHDCSRGVKCISILHKIETRCGGSPEDVACRKLATVSALLKKGLA
ncbi:unnamed protein product [Urochloa humidicola]